MNVSLYQAASALNANARWQEVITENLASSSIPGYKKQELSFSAIEAGRPAQPGAQAIAYSTPYAKTATSFIAGDMKNTGVQTDVAIEGRGFFEIQLPSGGAAYTRDGEFQLNSQGDLVTKEGHLVIGDGGPIQMDRNNPGPISISPTGEVSQGQFLRGTLKVVDFNQPELLTPLGGGFFLANDPNLQAQDLNPPSVRQGFLEGSNSSPVTEMSNLISSMRAFEANQKIIQAHDERMGRVISELGDAR